MPCVARPLHLCELVRLMVNDRRDQSIAPTRLRCRSGRSDPNVPDPSSPGSARAGTPGAVAGRASPVVGTAAVTGSVGACRRMRARVEGNPALHFTSNRVVMTMVRLESNYLKDGLEGGQGPASCVAGAQRAAVAACWARVSAS